MNNKERYGELYTPRFLINEMLDVLPKHVFKDKTLRWLDPGCGKGGFISEVGNRLEEGLKEEIVDDEERKGHVLKEMLYMVDINKEHEEYIKPYKNGKIANYLDEELYDYKFDIIIGNPPFNFGGIKKVPTNKIKKKQHDGKTIWIEFIKKSVSLLKENGLLLFLVPSIWMKEDRAKMYDFMTGFKLHKIRCFSNTEMNKIFKGEAQTPSCYFMLENKKTDNNVELYDSQREKYINYKLNTTKVMPLCKISTINNILPFTEKYGCIKIHKTNLPSRKISISTEKDEEHMYENVKTCVQKNKVPTLVINYSDKPCPYYNVPKVILAHSMSGFPMVDLEGKYGISNRDKYVITDYDKKDLIKLCKFLSQKNVQELFKCTRYRMMFLERYIFRLIPDVTKISKSDTEIITKLLI